MTKAPSSCASPIIREARRACITVLMLLMATTFAAFGCAGSSKHGQAADTKATTPRPKPTAINAPARSTPPSPRTPRPEMTAAQLVELERSYQLGVEAFDAMQLHEAVWYFESIREALPHFRETESYLRRAYLAIGMEQYTNGDPQAAIRIWKNVLLIDPKDEQALAYIRRTEAEVHTIERLSEEKKP